MAERFGFANANSAKATWSGIRRKLDKIDKGTVCKFSFSRSQCRGSADCLVAPSLTITPFETKDKSANKKRKTTDDSDEDEDDAMPTPKSSKKKGRMAKYLPSNSASSGFGPASPAESEDRDDDEELPVDGRVFGNGDEIKHEV